MLVMGVVTPAGGVLAADEKPLPVPQPSPVSPAAQSPETDALPGEELSCRAQLERLGARFSEVEPISDGSGCAIAYPISLQELPGGVSLRRGVVLNCATAHAVAQWTSAVVAPTAHEIYRSPLARISVFSAYQCRLRNSQTNERLSEHATGNAIDIGGFELVNDKVIEVGFPAERERRRKRFLAVVREAACRYFTTVLGPGSDSYHNNHFHLDLAERSGGSRYCR